MSSSDASRSDESRSDESRSDELRSDESCEKPPTDDIAPGSAPDPACSEQGAEDEPGVEDEPGTKDEPGAEDEPGSKSAPTSPGAKSAPGATGELSPELREHLRARRRAGDGWVETPKGRFWGLFGAAGLLLHDPDRGVLLQHRVSWSAHGGTWGIPGGAIDAGETPLTGAIRECHEEAGVPQLDGADIRIIHTHVVDMEGWSYTTVVARTLARLEEYINDIESVELRWVPLPEVTDYPLHPGFAASWLKLREVLEG